MKVLISGGSGLIGQAISSELNDQGHEVFILTRDPDKYRATERVTYVGWDPATGMIERDAVNQCDAIINLAGASVSERWTKHHKKSIMESRIDATRTLVEALNSDQSKIFISASAVGIYMDHTEMQFEASSPGEGFLADVVKAWENEARRAEINGHRTVIIRIGVVLAKEGGALERMLPVFNLGLGSVLGTGKQYMSWIHVRDLARLFLAPLENPKLNGVYNGVAPNPTTNRAFSKSLAKTLKKPFWAPPVPGFILKLMLGEMSQIVLQSQRISSKKIEEAGFRFEFEELNDALEDLI